MKRKVKEVVREITPLTQQDCFTIFSRTKDGFDFPLHYHEEFELNYIENAQGAQRVVGDHLETIENRELVLIGPLVHHAWFNAQCRQKNIKEITIQFHKDLFEDKFLNKNQLSFLKSMLLLSGRGIAFSQETIQQVAPRINNLNKKNGFDSVLELMSILHDLSISRNMRILSDTNFLKPADQYHSTRIDRTFDFMTKNLDKEISLKEVAKLANMTEVSFSRFFKQKTGSTFIESLNDIRISQAARMLIETAQTVSEIAYACGFNNMSNFNRTFKRKKGCSPKEFRMTYSGRRIFI